MGWGHFVQIGKYFAFQVQHLQNRFNDIIGIFNRRFHTGSKRYSLPGGLGLLFGQAAFFDAAGKVRVGKGFRFFENFLVDVGAGGRVTMNSTQQGNLMSHVAGADNGHVFNVVDVHVLVPFFCVW